MLAVEPGAWEGLSELESAAPGIPTSVSSEHVSDGVALALNSMAAAGEGRTGRSGAPAGSETRCSEAKNPKRRGLRLLTCVSLAGWHGTNLPAG